MENIRRIVLALLVALLCGATVWAQEEFNPTNPADPYMLYKVVAKANDGNYTSGSGQYTAGTVVTINASASSTAFTFQYWKKNGVRQDGLTQCFNYTVEAENVNFEAVFAFTPDNPADPQTINEFRLYLNPNIEGACSFSRTSGTKVEAGTNPVVTAYASQGFTFQGWYNGNTKISSVSTLTDFTMPAANTTLTAHFIFNPTTPGDPESVTDNVDMGGITGDLDDDGELSVTDVVLLVNAVMDSSSISDISKYDMDEDGELSVTDVVLLVNMVMNN